MDELFTKTISKIQELVASSPLNRIVKVRIKAWITKLQEPTTNQVWKGNRNAHTNLLLRQLSCTGRLGSPFNSLPNEGPLPTLQHHHKYACMPALPRNRSTSPQPLQEHPKKRSASKRDSQMVKVPDQRASLLPSTHPSSSSERAIQNPQQDGHDVHNTTALQQRLLSLARTTEELRNWHFSAMMDRAHHAASELTYSTAPRDPPTRFHSASESRKTSSFDSRRSMKGWRDDGHQSQCPNTVTSSAMRHHKERGHSSSHSSPLYSLSSRLFVSPPPLSSHREPWIRRDSAYSHFIQRRRGRGSANNLLLESLYPENISEGGMLSQKVSVHSIPKHKIDICTRQPTHCDPSGAGRTSSLISTGVCYQPSPSHSTSSFSFSRLLNTDTTLTSALETNTSPQLIRPDRSRSPDPVRSKLLLDPKHIHSTPVLHQDAQLSRVWRSPAAQSTGSILRSPASSSKPALDSGGSRVSTHEKGTFQRSGSTSADSATNLSLPQLNTLQQTSRIGATNVCHSSHSPSSRLRVPMSPLYSTTLFKSMPTINNLTYQTISNSPSPASTLRDMPSRQTASPSLLPEPSRDPPLLSPVHREGRYERSWLPRTSLQEVRVNSRVGSPVQDSRSRHPSATERRYSRSAVVGLRRTGGILGTEASVARRWRRRSASAVPEGQNYDHGVNGGHLRLHEGSRYAQVAASLEVLQSSLNGNRGVLREGDAEGTLGTPTADWQQQTSGVNEEPIPHSPVAPSAVRLKVEFSPIRAVSSVRLRAVEDQRAVIELQLAEFEEHVLGLSKRLEKLWSLPSMCGSCGTGSTALASGSQAGPDQSEEQSWKMLKQCFLKLRQAIMLAQSYMGLGTAALLTQRARQAAVLQQQHAYPRNSRAQTPQLMRRRHATPVRRGGSSRKWSTSTSPVSRKLMSLISGRSPHSMNLVPSLQVPVDSAMALLEDEVSELAAALNRLSLATPMLKHAANSSAAVQSHLRAASELERVLLHDQREVVEAEVVREVSELLNACDVTVSRIRTAAGLPERGERLVEGDEAANITSVRNSVAPQTVKKSVDRSQAHNILPHALEIKQFYGQPVHYHLAPAAPFLHNNQMLKHRVSPLIRETPQTTGVSPLLPLDLSSILLRAASPRSQCYGGVKRPSVRADITVANRTSNSTNKGLSILDPWISQEAGADSLTNSIEESLATLLDERRTLSINPEPSLAGKTFLSAADHYMQSVPSSACGPSLSLNSASVAQLEAITAGSEQPSRHLPLPPSPAAQLPSVDLTGRPAVRLLPTALREQLLAAPGVTALSLGASSAAMGRLPPIRPEDLHSRVQAVPSITTRYNASVLPTINEFSVGLHPGVRSPATASQVPTEWPYEEVNAQGSSIQIGLVEQRSAEVPSPDQHTTTGGSSAAPCWQQHHITTDSNLQHSQPHPPGPSNPLHPSTDGLRQNGPFSVSSSLAESLRDAAAEEHARIERFHAQHENLLRESSINIMTQQQGVSSVGPAQQSMHTAHEFTADSQQSMYRVWADHSPEERVTSRVSLQQAPNTLKPTDMPLQDDRRESLASIPPAAQSRSSRHPVHTSFPTSGLGQAYQQISVAEADHQTVQMRLRDAERFNQEVLDGFHRLKTMLGLEPGLLHGGEGGAESSSYAQIHLPPRASEDFNSLQGMPRKQPSLSGSSYWALRRTLGLHPGHHTLGQNNDVAKVIQSHSSGLPLSPSHMHIHDSAVDARDQEYKSSEQLLSKLSMYIMPKERRASSAATPGQREASGVDPSIVATGKGGGVNLPSAGSGALHHKLTALHGDVLKLQLRVLAGLEKSD
ncbi:hypothetical protein CEUSTIGMA_g6315.t1 [Chlamydomonas eustigma]|uniref:DUF4485 domain-containing protein n=1 Tax=Chlamydomonas eustigma TaxID=1157962 RepID=A0A250X752_9CHLO|nr:hypothetical protein CEUSTIGMA_g6315.t1 [Chlamydomonas eustigma]|eukprot:GAX78876.1 hypothetical protein CEUSTIGMA_g6315.t1 [Chlamydomonas eustigma]